MTSGEEKGDASVRDQGTERAETGARRSIATLTVLAGALFAFAYRNFLLPGAYFSIEKSLEYWFFSPNQTSAVVVLALSSWLLVRRWARLRALPARTGSAFGTGVAFAGALLVLGWARYVSAPELMAFSLALTATGTALLYRGLPGLRVCWLPIFFLLFAVPIPVPLMLALVWKMQILTAEYAGWLLFLISEPALVSGDQIVRASQTFQVIETCSGLQSTQTLTMLAVVLIDLFRRRGAHAVLLLVCAPAIAFALNGVRVLTLILNPHSELLGVHTLQGVSILLAGLMLVYWLDGLIEKLLPDPSEQSRLERASRGGVARAPLSHRQRAVAAATIGAAAALVSVLTPVWNGHVRGPGTLRARIDEAAGNWPAKDVPKDWMFQGTVRFGDSAHREYLIKGEPVEIFVGTANLARGGGSPLSPSTGFPSAGWHVVESGRQVLAGNLIVRASVLQKGNTQMLVYHWYAGSKGLGRETLWALLGLDQSRFRRAEPLYVARLGTRLEPQSAETAAKTRGRAEFRLGRAYMRLAPALAEL